MLNDSSAGLHTLWLNLLMRGVRGGDCALVEGFDPASVKHTLNKWIVSEAVRATKAVEQGIADYRFNDAAGAIYGFTWNVFCDWYIELTKPIFLGADEATKTETRATAAWARSSQARAGARPPSPATTCHGAASSSWMPSYHLVPRRLRRLRR